VSLRWTRRRFLEASALAAAAAAAPSVAARAKAKTPPGFDEYRRHDAVSLARMVRRGDVTAAELLELAIARAEAVDPKLTAIVVRHFEEARAAAAGATRRLDRPLAGVPFLLKDLGIAMAGTITTEGSRFFRDQRHDFDSTLVERYRAAGLVVFGKTHSPEFGSSPSSESVLHGATHNPWDLSRSAGGSSGGAAAAVAAGIVPVAHATDGGGSIRIPASACGLFGLKPSRGRVPMGPRVYEGWGGMSAAHCVSRSVRDSAALLDATQGPAIGDAYAAPPRERPYLEEIERAPGRLRIAWMRKPVLPAEVDPECDAAAERAATLCVSLGHEVEEAAPTLDLAAVYQGFSLLASAGTALKIAQREAVLGRAARRDEIEAVNWTTLETGRAASGVDYARAREAIHGASRELGRFLEKYDLILSPTMALVPAKLGVLSLSQDTAAFTGPATRASGFTSLFNITGQPAMSVPLHWTAPLEGATEGLPIGVQFAARFGDEATLFRLAAQLERAQPWIDRLAPI
jgi:Asp-tRNA(Asn)/Glu-tRNA(Gln) amidotransferase A subunit family amidase